MYCLPQWGKQKKVEKVNKLLKNILYIAIQKTIPAALYSCTFRAFQQVITHLSRGAIAVFSRFF
jgi:hypothetical protein